MACCGDCRHRVDGACSFSEDKENPARPNHTEDCVMKPSRFERKPNPHGRVISPLQSPNPAPRNPEIRSPTPEPTGYSLVCRQSPDKLGAIQFLLKDGLCYSADSEMRYLGTLEEMTPKPPTEEEIDRAIRWARRKFNLEEALNVYCRREDPEQCNDAEAIRGITDEMAQGDLGPNRENDKG